MIQIQIITRHSSNYHRLLLPQPPRYLHRNLQRLRHNARRSKRQPLRQRYIHDPIAFVNLDPLQSFVGGGVLHVVAGVVWEDGGVAGGEVEGAGCGLSRVREELSVGTDEEGFLDSGWVLGVVLVDG